MKRFLPVILTGLMLLGALLVLPGSVLADTYILESDINDSGSFDVGEILSATDGTSEQDQSYLTDENNAPVISFILDIINFITRVIGAIAMLLIIVGGLMMIVSQGEEHLLQKGKDTLTSAIFGLAIAMFSYLIVRFVQSLFYLQ